MYAECRYGTDTQVKSECSHSAPSQPSDLYAALS